MRYSMFTRFGAIVDECGIEAAAKFAKEHGFSGVEFFYMVNNPERVPSVEVAAEYKRVLDEIGLEVACVSAGATLVRNHDPKSISKPDFDGLIRGLDFTKAVGAKYFHHTLIMTLEKEKLGDLTYESVYPVALEGAKRVADYAKSLGITVLYEPQGAFFNGVERLGEFFEEMLEYTDNVALCGDTGNTCWVSEEPYDFFEKYATYVRHVHLKDYEISKNGTPNALVGDYEMTSKRVGLGSLDFERLIASLNAVNYNGFASLEDYANVETDELIAGAMAYVSPYFKS